MVENINIFKKSYTVLKLTRTNADSIISIGQHMVLSWLLIVACSQATIPLNPIPMTLQVLGICIVATSSSVAMTAAILGSWLFAGASGLPVFAGYQGGLSILMGVRGGYLVGFFLASITLSFLTTRFSFPSVFSRLGLYLCGIILIHLCGVTYLAYLTNLEFAIKVGLYPFVLGDIMKAFVLAIIAPSGIRSPKAKE